MIKVGINGFGRIGRLAFRSSVLRDNVQVVAINDLLDVDYLAYMLKYDSVHGKFDGTVEVKDGKLVVNGNEIRITAERDPANLKWDEIGAEYVIESTGFFLTEETAGKHLQAGAKKVVLSAPSKDHTPMFVMGVNNTELTADQQIFSNASCSTPLLIRSRSNRANLADDPYVGSSNSVTHPWLTSQFGKRHRAPVILGHISMKSLRPMFQTGPDCDCLSERMSTLPEPMLMAAWRPPLPSLRSSWLM